MKWLTQREEKKRGQMAKGMEETSSTVPPLLQWIIRAFARCLGFLHGSNDPSKEEDGTTPTEERSIVRIQASRSPEKPPTDEGRGGSINSILLASRSPRKPSPSEGGGGQINPAQGGSSNSAVLASRSPRKPSPSEGRGGQINSALS